MRVRAGTVFHDLGNVLRALSGIILVSVPVSVVWGEFYAVPALVISGLVPLLTGSYLVKRYSDPEEPGKLHGMIIASTSWFSVALFGSLPFVLVALTSEAGLLGAPEPT
ncbi:MAG: TrkH family potassium uptake protein, partial [Halobacteria archaeon]|nr:TrkH family potassium uptake protein [Halobacteria archaeon]